MNSPFIKKKKNCNNSIGKIYRGSLFLLKTNIEFTKLALLVYVLQQLM